MKTYRVLFDTRNHKRACSTSFTVSAASVKDAEIIAVRLLRQCGENPLHTEELLTMAQ